MMSSNCCTRAMAGWLVGCIAATFAFFAYGMICFVYGMLGPGLSSGGLSPIVIVLAFVFLASICPPIFMVTILLTGFPAAIVIWASERFRIRSVVFFGGSGLVIAALIQYLLQQIFSPFALITGMSFVVAGLAAGLTYWRMAGRYAGGDPVRSVR